MPYLLIALGVVVLSYVVYDTWRRAHGAGPRVSDAKAGEIAARLGLAVVDGDPEAHLTHLVDDHERASPERKDGATRRRHGVAMRGMPKGRMQSFHYFVESTLTLIDTTLVTDFVLRTEVHASFPEFEVVSRKVHASAIETPVRHVVEMRTGNAAVDDAFVVRTTDQRLAKTLAPHLVPIVSYTFVHLYGLNGSLYCVASHDTGASAARCLEQLAALHHVLAVMLEGFGGAPRSMYDSQPTTR